MVLLEDKANHAEPEAGDSADGGPREDNDVPYGGLCHQLCPYKSGVVKGEAMASVLALPPKVNRHEGRSDGYRGSVLAVQDGRGVVGVR